MELIEIKCPFKYKDKFTDQIKSCDRLCVKVYPGSAGEAKCKSCKQTFDFQVNDQAFMKISIKAKNPDERES